MRFFKDVRVFEVGKTFVEKDKLIVEETKLGIALGARSGNPILELKGMADELLKQLGLTDIFFRDLEWDLRHLEQSKSLRIESDHQVIGYLGVPKGEQGMAILEIDLEKSLKLVQGEKEYEPLSKYPSVDRDISIFVGQDVRIDQLMAAMENAAPALLDDVDLLDYYDPSIEGKNTKKDHKSLTFRLVFQSGDHTLTDEEVNAEMTKIILLLEEKFGAEVR